MGLLVGTWSLDGLLALAPAGLPRMDEIGLDGRVLAFTFGVAAVTGTAFGLTGAWHAFRTDLNTALRDGGARQGTSRAETRVRSAFVAVQAGLAVVLLSGAGLLIASFHRLRQVELGFDRTACSSWSSGDAAGYVEEGGRGRSSGSLGGCVRSRRDRRVRRVRRSLSGNQLNVR